MSVISLIGEGSCSMAKDTRNLSVICQSVHLSIFLSSIIYQLFIGPLIYLSSIIYLSIYLSNLSIISRKTDARMISSH
jgi:hypothetical protein